MNNVVAMPSNANASTAGSTRMVMTFELQSEVFAIDVANVHEVIDPLPLTPVPNSGSFAPGLVNVRGAVVPVLNLQHRLGMPEHEQSQDTRFVVLEADTGDGPAKFAVIADSVDEVVELPADAIQPIPELGLRWPTELIEGVAQLDERLIILLNQQTAFRPAFAS